MSERLRNQMLRQGGKMYLFKKKTNTPINQSIETEFFNINSETYIEESILAIVTPARAYDIHSNTTNVQRLFGKEPMGIIEITVAKNTGLKKDDILVYDENSQYNITGVEKWDNFDSFEGKLIEEA